MGSPGRAHGDTGRQQALAEPVRALVALFAHRLGPALEDLVQLVDRTDFGDDVHRDLVLVPRGIRDVDPPKGSSRTWGCGSRTRRARPCPPRSSARAGPRPSPATPSPARARLRPAGGGPLRRTRRCPSAAHYRRPGRLESPGRRPVTAAAVGGIGGARRPTLP